MADQVQVNSLSPPLGGGLGNPAGGGSNPPVSPPSLMEMAAAEAAKHGVPLSPPALPGVQPGQAPVSPPPPPGPTLEELQAQLAAMPTEEEMAQLRELARFGYEQKLIQQGKTLATQSAAPAVVNPLAPHPITGVIPFSEADKAFLRADEKGEIVAIPGAPADILARWHAHTRTRQEYLHRLATEPDKVFGTLIEEKAQAIAEKMFREQFQKTNQQTTIDKIVSENRHWIFQLDGQGHVIRDAMGSPRLTPAGAIYQGFINQLQDAGVTDVMVQHEMARRAVLGQMYEQNQNRTLQVSPTPQAPLGTPTAPQLTKDQLEAQARQNLLFQAQQAAASAPATGGAMLTPPTKRPSFMDITRQKAREMGVTL